MVLVRSLLIVTIGFAVNSFTGCVCDPDVGNKRFANVEGKFKGPVAGVGGNDDLVSGLFFNAHIEGYFDQSSFCESVYLAPPRSTMSRTSNSPLALY